MKFVIITLVFTAILSTAFSSMGNFLRGPNELLEEEDYDRLLATSCTIGTNTIACNGTKYWTCFQSDLSKPEKENVCQSSIRSDRASRTTCGCCNGKCPKTCPASNCKDSSDCPTGVGCSLVCHYKGVGDTRTKCVKTSETFNHLQKHVYGSAGDYCGSCK